MIDGLTYKFKNRNSKKNLKKDIQKLREQLTDLRHETIGQNRNGWITFGYSTPKHDSLNKKIDDLHDYLGIDYAESKLAPKPKEKK